VSEALQRPSSGEPRDTASRPAQSGPERSGSDPIGGIHLDLVMAAAGVGWFDWDPRLDHLVFDERACRLFGIDPETFDHRVASFWERVHPEDVADVEAAVQHALETCGSYEAEYRVVLPGGDVRWVEARGKVLSGEDGTAARMLGVARDTTDLRTARDTVARALEHMADAFVAVDRSWRVTYLNRNAEALLGTGPEAVGQVLWDVWTGLVGQGLDRVLK
jgi:PAS domain S-box-containing protein